MDINAKENNQLFLDKVTSGDAQLTKEAADTVNEFTRVKMREDGFARKVLPIQPLADSEIDRQVNTDKPVKIIDKEPNSPSAVSIGFGQTPPNRQIAGSRYAITFDRVMTRRYHKDVAELRTYHMDIRQVISDNAIKDMLAEEDSKFIMAANVAMGGSAALSAAAGLGWVNGDAEGVSRQSFKNARQVMPKLGGRLEPTTMLTNNICIKEFDAFDRTMAGGDISEQMFLNGFTTGKLSGLDVIVSIKHDLLSEWNNGSIESYNTAYFFAEPKFLGKFFSIEDTTMFIKQEAFYLEFYAYELVGGAIGNSYAVSRYDWGNPS